LLKSSEEKKFKTADGKTVSNSNDAMKKARKKIFDGAIKSGKGTKKLDATTFGAINGASASFFSDLKKEKPKPKPTPKPAVKTTVTKTVTIKVTVSGSE